MSDLDFKEKVWRQIEERNQVYNKFSCLYKSYTEVCEDKKCLETSNLRYKDEIEKVTHENYLLLTNLDLGKPNGQFHDAQIAALQCKCSKLQEELTETSGVKRGQEQQISELTAQFQETERQMMEKIELVQEKESEINKLKNQVASLKQKEAELKQANQTLTDQNKDLKVAEKSSRDILLECQRHNQQTAEAWIELQSTENNNNTIKGKSPFQSTTASISRPSTSNASVHDNNSEFINEFLDHPDVENVLVAQCPSRQGGSSPGKGRAFYESYFVKDGSGNVIAVFKPHTTNAHESDCLVPNNGYLSETAASVVDSCLNLNIVPKAKVVHLVSGSLKQNIIDRANAHVMQYATSRFPGDEQYNGKGRTQRVGFMQTFVDGYEDVDYWLKIKRYPAEYNKEYQFQFEKLVVLDYLICNTGRRKDNWFIKFDKSHCDENESSHKDPSKKRVMKKMMKRNVSKTRVNIKATGNSRAFPFKHPEPQKSYPYHWCELPEARRPFSKEIKNLVLGNLSDMNFFEDVLLKLYQLFSRNKSFDPIVCEKQFSVMRGQGLNLIHAMRNDRSPLQLVEMPPVIVEKTRNALLPPNMRDSYSQMFVKLDRKKM